MSSTNPVKSFRFNGQTVGVIAEVAMGMGLKDGQDLSPRQLLHAMEMQLYIMNEQVASLIIAREDMRAAVARVRRFANGN